MLNYSDSSINTFNHLAVHPQRPTFDQFMNSTAHVAFPPPAREPLRAGCSTRHSACESPRCRSGLNCQADVIYTCNMTIESLPGTYSGEFRVDLPGGQFMAVRMRRI